MRHPLHLATWSRRAHFEFFRSFDEPFFGVCAEVDCTRAYETAKTRNCSFFLYYLHASLVAANMVEPFRYRILDGKVWVYDQVNASPTMSTEKSVRARLLFDEAVDPHAGSAAWKGIVIGASMYLLAPFIPLEYDYAAHLSLELERWDGQIKRYESQSAGTARYYLFGATPIMVRACAAMPII